MPELQPPTGERRAEWPEAPAGSSAAARSGSLSRARSASVRTLGSIQELGGRARATGLVHVGSGPDVVHTTSVHILWLRIHGSTPSGTWLWGRWPVAWWHLCSLSYYWGLGGGMDLGEQPAVSSRRVTSAEDLMFEVPVYLPWRVWALEDATWVSFTPRVAFSSACGHVPGHRPPSRNESRTPYTPGFVLA